MSSSQQPTNRWPSGAGPPSSWSSPLSTKHARYVSLFCSFLVALSAGSNYGFSSYSPQLQERLHLSSTQINIVGVMGNMGVYCSGPLWGRLVDKRGPRTALLAGALLVLFGYGGLSASYKGSLWHTTSLPVLAFFALCTGLGNCGAFTAAMNAQAKSWREERRGLCTAMVLSGFGLSAFFYSTLSHTLFPGKTSDYLLLLALGSCLSFLIGLSFIRILPPSEEDEDGESDTAAGLLRPGGPRKRVQSQALSSVDGDEDAPYTRPRSSYSRRRTSSDIGGRAWAYASRANEEEDEEREEAEVYGDRVDSVTRNDNRRHEQQGLLNHDASDDLGGVDGHASSDHLAHSSGTRSATHKSTALPDPSVTNNKTGWKLARDVDFLLLFFIMTIISGTGLLIINNIGTMTRTLYEYNKRQPDNITSTGGLNSLAGSSSPVKPVMKVILTSLPVYSMDAEAFSQGDVQQLQAHQVSAISIGNALGRIIMGLLSDVTVNWTGHPRFRVCMLLLICTLALLSQGVAAWPNIIRDLKKLLGMSAVTGLMYGTLFGLCPVLTFEWFGLRHFSQNWGIISLSPVIAGNIFNLLFGKIYDSHVPPDVHPHICPDGEECFRAVFQFTAVGAVVATILSVILIARKASAKRTLANALGSSSA